MASQLFLKPDFVLVSFFCFAYLIDNKLISCVLIKNTAFVTRYNIKTIKCSLKKIKASLIHLNHAIMVVSI